MRRETISLLLDTLQLRDGPSTESLRARWTGADAQRLMALVRHEGAEIWLYKRLRQLQIEPPATLQTELRHTVNNSSIANMRIDAQTFAVVGQLNAAGIPWSLIKGQARRAAESLYPFASARAVSDVDLLVPEPQADHAWQHLCDGGFRRLINEPVLWKADHHRPALIDDRNVCVELHTTTCLAVAPAEAWRRATANADVVKWEGTSTTVPNATELVWQALSHGVADGVRSFTLRSFLSVAAILAQRPTIDWALLSSRIAADEVVDNERQTPVSHERIRQWLEVSASLAGYELPDELRPHRRVGLSRLLRWRAQILDARLGRAVRERLLEEAERSEASLPITPVDQTTDVLRQFRRKGSSVIARGLYRAWCLRS